MTLVWSRTARADVEAIGQYIAAHDRAAADRIVRRLVEAGPVLEAHPGLGRPGRVQTTREFVVAGTPYIIVYREVDGGVEIARALHAARLWPKAFQKSLA